MLVLSLVLKKKYVISCNSHYVRMKEVEFGEIKKIAQHYTI